MATNHLGTVEAFLKDHPTIKYIPPSSKDFAAACDIWNGSRPDQPLAVVQPQSSQDVATLIKFLKSDGNNIPFSIRSGGNNLEGLALVQDALLIDLRALNSVVVAVDRKSATVGGGILQGDLVDKLWKEGQLAAATGTIPHVGFFGWASYGGYGPFSSHWGLGVDQIIGATVVNPSGDLIELQGDDDPVLGGIRGAGGVFGVIVDLTIKVYPAPYVRYPFIHVVRASTDSSSLLALGWTYHFRYYRYRQNLQRCQQRLQQATRSRNSPQTAHSSTCGFYIPARPYICLSLRLECHRECQRY